jgi:hypothetical protein
VGSLCLKSFTFYRLYEHIYEPYVTFKFRRLENKEVCCYVFSVLIIEYLYIISVPLGIVGI